MKIETKQKYFGMRSIRVVSGRIFSGVGWVLHCFQAIMGSTSWWGQGTGVDSTPTPTPNLDADPNPGTKRPKNGQETRLRRFRIKKMYRYTPNLPWTTISPLTLPVPVKFPEKFPEKSRKLPTDLKKFILLQNTHFGEKQGKSAQATSTPVRKKTWLFTSQTKPRGSGWVGSGKGVVT